MCGPYRSLATRRNPDANAGLDHADRRDAQASAAALAFRPQYMERARALGKNWPAPRYHSPAVAMAIRGRLERKLGPFARNAVAASGTETV